MSLVMLTLRSAGNFMSPFVLMSGSWQKECALPNKRNSYQQPHTCSQLYTSTSLCVPPWFLLQANEWYFLVPCCFEHTGYGWCAEGPALRPALPVHLCAHGNGGKTVRGPRRGGERRPCLPTTWLLPFSLFYILTNHVRGIEKGKGEAAFSHFCHLSCQTLQGYFLWLGWFQEFVDICYRCCYVVFYSIKPGSQAEVTRVKVQSSHSIVMYIEHMECCTTHSSGLTLHPWDTPWEISIY